jgi:hypothetical protein
LRVPRWGTLALLFIAASHRIHAEPGSGRHGPSEAAAVDEDLSETEAPVTRGMESGSPDGGAVPAQVAEPLAPARDTSPLREDEWFSDYLTYAGPATYEYAYREAEFDSKHLVWQAAAPFWLTDGFLDLPRIGELRSLLRVALSEADANIGPSVWNGEAPDPIAPFVLEAEGLLPVAPVFGARVEFGASSVLNEHENHGGGTMRMLFSSAGMYAYLPLENQLQVKPPQSNLRNFQPSEFLSPLFTKPYAARWRDWERISPGPHADERAQYWSAQDYRVLLEPFADVLLPTRVLRFSDQGPSTIAYYEWVVDDDVPRPSGGLRLSHSGSGLRVQDYLVRNYEARDEQFEAHLSVPGDAVVWEYPAQGRPRQLGSAGTDLPAAVLEWVSALAPDSRPQQASD